MKRYTDPLRAIVERVQAGAGSDTLLLECGHQIVANHKPEHKGRKRCHGCRVYAA